MMMKLILVIMLIVCGSIVSAWWWFIKRNKTQAHTTQTHDQSQHSGIQQSNSVQQTNNKHDYNESQQVTYVKLVKQITDIVSLLTSSHLNQLEYKNRWRSYFNKNAAVYALPWIMVMGSSASGKSTLIKQSQLHFPLTNIVNTLQINAQEDDHPVHSQWLLADNGVLIDSCGHYVDDENYLFEWFSLLKLLKKYRRQLPLNGIVMTIDFSAIIIADDGAMKKMASVLRERLADIAKVLGYVIPIYMMFTKMDHLSGFVEYFADWIGHQREQAWGISLDHASQYAQRMAVLNQQMQLLYHKILQCRLSKIAHADNPQKKLAIFNFSEQFRAVTPAILSFMRLLLKENPYQETPLFAGIYFSSGMQSCFIKEMFSEIVFNQQTIALKNRDNLRRMRWLKSMILISSACLTIGLWILFGTALARNSELLQRGVQIVAELSQRINGNSSDGYHFQDYTIPVVPAYLHLGLYRGNLLIPYIRYLLLQNVKIIFLQPTAHLLETQLQDDVRRWSQSNEMQREQLRGSYYSLLKVYLMLCFSHKRDNNFADAVLYQLWQPLLSTQQTLSPNTINNFMQLAADNLQWQVNPQLVNTARAQLNSTAANNMYAEIRSAGIAQLGYTSLAVLLHANNAHELQSQYQLPVLFTARGWQQFAGAAIQQSAKFATQGDWVIDESLQELDRFNTSEVTDDSSVIDSNIATTSNSDVDHSTVINSDITENSNAIVNNRDALANTKAAQSAQLTAQLQQLYFADYKQNWLAFLQSIQLSHFHAISDAAQQLQILASAQGPYAQLFQLIADNSYLTTDNTSNLLPLQKSHCVLPFGDLNDCAISLAMKSPHLPYNQFDLRYLQQLTQLQSEIAQLAISSDLPTAAQHFAAQLLSDNNTTLNADIPVINSSLSSVNGNANSMVTGNMSGGSSGRANIANDNTIDYSENNSDSALYRSSLFCAMSVSHINDAATQAVISNLLLLPVTETWRVILSTVAQSLEQQWRIEVVNVYQQNLAHQQPFVMSGDEANYEDVTHFFQPNNGIFWQFFLQHITPYITTDGDGFKERTWLNIRMGFSQPFLSALAQTQQMTRGFFGQYNEQQQFANAQSQFTNEQTQFSNISPQFTFEIFPIPTPGLDEIMLTTNGQTYRYRNEPQEWQKLKWPGNTPNDDTVLEIIAAQDQNHATLEINSVWGFFELLRHASITSVASGTLRATWQLTSDDGRHYRVSMLVRMNNRANLFYLLTVQKYILPLNCFA